MPDDKGKDEGAGKTFDSQAEIDRVRDQILGSSEPGRDPESKRRVAKTLEAQGVTPPKGYSSDPIPVEDRGDGKTFKPEKDDAADDAAAKRSAEPSRVQGRTTSSPTKSATAKS